MFGGDVKEFIGSNGGLENVILKSDRRSCSYLKLFKV